MTINDIPNIEHCDVSMVGTIAYRVVAHEGWYIHLADEVPIEDENDNPLKVYKTIAILRTNYDFSLVEITAEADLPDNAEICGDTGGNDHEVM